MENTATKLTTIEDWRAAKAAADEMPDLESVAGCVGAPIVDWFEKTLELLEPVLPQPEAREMALALEGALSECRKRLACEIQCRVEGEISDLPREIAEEFDPSAFDDPCLSDIYEAGQASVFDALFFLTVEVDAESL